jgi:hypothetical protein
MKRIGRVLLVGLLALFASVLTVAAAETTLAPAASDVYLPLVGSEPRPGIWMSAGELAKLPTSGAGWSNVVKWAQESISQPNLSDPLDATEAAVVARALVYARTGQGQYREQVVAAINAVIGTESGAEETLEIARNLTGYVVAADLVGLPPEVDGRFRPWLASLRHKNFDDLTLITTHEKRANNWGTHAGAARIAVALYLGDTADLERAATVFHGWLGNRSAYVGFNFGSDMSWQCDPLNPVPVNPAGCSIAGFPVDGVLADDQRRAGAFSWPPPQENYVWEALQGAVGQAWMLERAGYPAFSWQNQALLRAVTWLCQVANFPASGDDTGTSWLINGIYGTQFPASSTVKPGKNGLGYYDWLLGLR